VLTFLTRKLLSSVAAYVVKYIGLFDAHMCLSWWVVFSLVLFCTACLLLQSNITNRATECYNIILCRKLLQINVEDLNEIRDLCVISRI
jgi:hypothetical protein